MGDDAKVATRLKGPSGAETYEVARGPASEVESALSHGPQEFVQAGRWREIAEEISGAQQVAIYGIAPRPLLEALRSLLEARDIVSGALPPISYYTAAPQAALRAYADNSGTRPANRWQVGFMGLRNLIDAAAKGPREPGEPAAGALFTLPSSFSDCIVVTRHSHKREAIRYFSVLPSHPGASETARIIELDATSIADPLRAYLREVATTASRLQLREVICEPASPGPRPSDAPEAPTMMGFAPYGGNTTGSRQTLKPVAIVVLRCPRADGDHVLLKRRSPLTDNDNFGRMSLLSARVQEADVAAALGVEISAHEDHDEAYDRLWVRAGEPKPFILPMKALRLAAERELFVTCGLQLEERRLNFDGFYVVDGDGATQLGFGVFRAHLHRSPEPDEMSEALACNPHALTAVPLAELYDDRPDEPLNRLLVSGRDWLLETALAPDREEQA
ncbi:MAG TPA: hypothetical protein VFG58_07555 [Solirubrobacterales bacterium]|nr:hypothetical protein [Solirubrobacterales bacterium]